MKISLVQFAPSLFNRELNHKFVVEQISKSTADIIVFPELAFSGYFFLNKMEAMENAYSANSDEMNVFRDMAIELNKIIVVGFAESVGDSVFNSAAIFFPSPSYNNVYRKIHLFYKEKFAFEPGNKDFFVIEYKEWDLKIGLMICYDWRFPEAARTLGLLGADLIVCPSNLVTPIWPKVMPTRAIENKVYLAVANRFGTETREGEELLFNGQSTIYSYNGQPLAQADASGDQVITSEIFPEQTRDKTFNPINHIFKDRRPDKYLNLYNN